MDDHVHAYNIAVKAARTRLAIAVKEATDGYEQAHAPLLASFDLAMDKAGGDYRAAMAEAEAAYDEARAAYDDNPPF